MGNDAQGSGTDVTPDVDFAAIQKTERFQNLRRRHRRFVFPVLGLALVWYLVYVLLAGYAPDFMATPVLRFGPFVMLSLGRSGSGDLGAFASIRDEKVHEWIEIGFRGMLDL